MSSVGRWTSSTATTVRLDKTDSGHWKLTVGDRSMFVPSQALPALWSAATRAINGGEN